MQKAAFIIVDVQVDFCPGGSMAVRGGDEIIGPINSLLQDNAQSGGELFRKVVVTTDWHPLHHVSFADEHEGKQPYEIVEVDGLSQNLWPAHCVAGSRGAGFHPDLQEEYADLIIRKGTQANLDSYSAFFENDGETPTGLAGYLHEFGIEKIYLCGLAFDWCVYFSALDAHRLGFQTCVIEDLTRPVDVPEGTAAERKDLMLQKDIEVTALRSLYE